ncbi:hypothetical protein CCH79_00014700, partial [Gambusia affinis]
MKHHGNLSSLVHTKQGNRVYIHLGEDPTLPAVCQLQSSFLFPNYMTSDLQPQTVKGRSCPRESEASPEVHVIRLRSAGPRIRGSLQADVTVSLLPPVATSEPHKVVLILSCSVPVNWVITAPGVRGHVSVHLLLWSVQPQSVAAHGENRKSGPSFSVHISCFATSPSRSAANDDNVTLPLIGRFARGARRGPESAPAPHHLPVPILTSGPALQLRLFVTNGYEQTWTGPRVIAADHRIFVEVSAPFVHCSLLLCLSDSARVETTQEANSCQSGVPIPPLVPGSSRHQCEIRNLSRPMVVTRPISSLVTKLEPSAGQRTKSLSPESCRFVLHEGLLMGIVFAAFLVGVSLMGGLWCIHTYTGGYPESSRNAHLPNQTQAGCNNRTPPLLSDQSSSSV